MIWRCHHSFEVTPKDPRIFSLSATHTLPLPVFLQIITGILFLYLGSCCNTITHQLIALWDFRHRKCSDCLFCCELLRCDLRWTVEEKWNVLQEVVWHIQASEFLKTFLKWSISKINTFNNNLLFSYFLHTSDFPRLMSSSFSLTYSSVSSLLKWEWLHQIAI